MESRDIIKLIQQFLKEQGLFQSLKTLQVRSTISHSQSETGVILNTLEKESFIQQIKQGDWDSVLESLPLLDLSPDKLSSLYELLFLDLLELRQISPAQSLLQSSPLVHLRDHQPERYLHLTTLASLSHLTAQDAYPTLSKEESRARVAEFLGKEIDVVEPSRLLALLGQSLKWQKSQGLLPTEAAFDLFKGCALTLKDEQARPPGVCYLTIPFSKKQHPETALFSPDGQYFVTGTVDGFIEIWNYLTGKLRKDIKYQAEDAIMLMEAPVLCLGFSRDSQTLVSGAQNGRIKVWKITTGQCIRRFANAHTQGVTSVSLNKDGSHVLSTSFDHTIRIHGIKSGKMLKEFRGHSSFVNDAVYTKDYSLVVSGSSDGTIKIWDLKTTACLSTLSLYHGKIATAGMQSPAITRLLINPGNPSQIIVTDRSSYIYVIDPDSGTLIKSLASDYKSSAPHFVSASVSGQGRFIYACTETGSLSVFDTESAELIKTLQVADKEVIGMNHHPFSNILTIYDDAGNVKFWKP